MVFSINGNSYLKGWILHANRVQDDGGCVDLMLWRINMIRVLIPKDEEFWEYQNECKRLYEKVQGWICDTNSFEFIVNNTFFYLFLNDKKLIGAIYYFVDENNKLYLNGFAKRKMHLLNIECLKMSLKWFKGDIHAVAQNRMSELCLRRCGFELVGGKEFVYRG